jgi:aldehyde:ferredoxin oxidoreductase
MKGYWGKALVVDLSSETSAGWKIPGEWLRDYIGGEGVGVRYLADLITPETKPFAKEQPLIFATGPLTGTSAPASGRCVVVFRSPATGTLGLSNAGGHFAPALKKAGWDVLIITGQASKPVYLSINDDKLEIRSAEGIWGKGTTETDRLVKEDLNDSKIQVASIAQAGENKVLMAAIMTDKHRAFGRGGAGAIMGSKNLKAIAVKGTKSLPVADIDTLRAAAADARKELLSEAFVKEELKPFGTPSFYDAIDALGLLPTRNWQRTTFNKSIETLGHKAYHERLEVKPYACSGCPIACGRSTTIKENESKWGGMHGGGPEYETLAAFGSKCEVTDLIAVTAANHISNDLGLDVISAGQAIATAMEWYDTGILDKTKTDGIELTFGNADAVVEMVKKIANREGIGDLLADGVKKAAEKLGGNAEYAAMHVKGLEMAADGVRASKGETLSHVISARGADHLRPFSSTIDAFGYKNEELGITEEFSYTEDGNKAWVKPFMELCMATNLLGTCLFTVITLAIKASTWARLLSAAIGQDVTKEQLLQASERVLNLERMVNASFGFDRKDDSLPKRFLEEPARDGRGEGEVVDLDKNLDSFYDAMGWNKENGLPETSTLQKLGLSWLQC